MFKQTLLKRELFVRGPKVFGLAIFCVVFILVAAITFIQPIPKVRAATNNTLNFQARLQTNTGALVPDGYYNIEFKLYDALSGGSLLWTETYYDSDGGGAATDNRVRVKNGYLTVNLGTLTTFPSTINWDQRLWISMNVGGSAHTATPTWNGEMSPRLSLTGVPYAFRAGELAKLNSGNGYSGVLQFQATTGGNQTFIIPDQGAAGTYTLMTTASASGSFVQFAPSSAQVDALTNSSIFINKTGASGNLLQLQKNGSDKFLITNAGNVGINATGANLLSVNNLTTADSVAQLALSTGATTNKGIVVQGVASQTANLIQLQASNGNVNTAFHAGGGLDLGGATLDTASSATTSVIGNKIYLWGNSYRISVQSSDLQLASGGGISLRPSVNNVGGTAINGQILQLSGTAANTLSVLRGAASQTGDLLQFQDSSTNIHAAFNSAGNQLTLGRVAASGTVSQGKVVLADGTTSNFGLTLQSATLTANRTLTLPNEDGTLCVQGSTACGFALSATNGYVQLAPAAAQTDSTTNSSIFINKTGASGNILQLQKGGSDVLAVSNTGAATFKNTTNSTSALSVQNAGSGTLFRVDTTGNSLYLNQANSGEFAGGWQANATSLPGTQAYFPMVHYGGFVYTLGGITTAGNIYYARVNTDGTIGSWSTASMPATRRNEAAVVSNGYLYIIGGNDNSGSAVNTVYYARLASDGSIGTWATTNTLPATVQYQRSFAANGYLYSVGGLGTSAVYYAKQNLDGTTSTWASTSSLPANVSAHAVTVANGYVYAIAGSASAAVYYAAINSNGTLGTWQTASNSLPAGAVNFPTAFTANGYLYSIGGSGATSAMYYSKLGANGAPGTWSTSSYSLPAVRQAHGTVVINGYAYLVGGYDGSVNQSTVYYIPLNRVQVTGTLDLLGGAGVGVLGTDSSAGELIAGRTTVNGTLQVTDEATFLNGLSLNGNFNAVGSVNIANSGGTTTSLLNLANPSGTVTNAINIGSGTFTTGINFNGATFANLIDSANFDVTNAGAITGASLAATGSVSVATTSGTLNCGINCRAFVGTATDMGGFLNVGGNSNRQRLILRTSTSQLVDTLLIQDTNGATLSKVDVNGQFISHGTGIQMLGLATPAFTTSSTGTSYYYVITATNAAGETVASASLGMANNTSNLQWNQVTGATGYKIYRNTSDSFTAGSLLLTTITNGTTVSFTDTGAATGAGLPPTNPTGTRLLLQGWESQGTLLQAQTSAGAAKFTVNANGQAIVNGGTALNNGIFSVQSAGTTTPVFVGRAVSGQTSNLVELIDSSNNVHFAVNSGGNQLTLGRIAGSGTVSQGKLVLSDGTTSNFGLTLQSTTLTANRTITFPDADGTVQLAPTTGSFIKQVPATTAENTIQPTAASIVGLTVNATSNATGAIAAVINQGRAFTALDINTTNTAGTQTNAVQIARNGSGGTTTNLLNLTNTTGTVTHGITFTGTFATNLINAPNFTVSNAGGVTGSTAVLSGANSLTVGTTGTNNGSIIFRSSNASAGDVTLRVSTTQGTTARTLTLPDEDGTLCIQGSTNCGFAPSATNGYVQLAPAAAQTDSTTNNSIFINKTGASGNLIQLQNSGSDVFTVSGAGAVSAVGVASTGGLSSSGGAVSLAGNAASSLTTSSGALTLTSAAATTWSTAAGNLTLQAGSGTVSLGTSTTLTSAGALTISSGGTGAFNLDTSGAAAMNIGTTNASSININRTGGTTTIYGATLYNAGGVLTVNNMPNFQTTGTIRMGRTDGTARYSDIITYNDSTAAANYIKFAVHNGTLGSTTDVLTLFGNATASFAGAVTAVGVNSGAGLLQGTGGLTLTGAVSINTTGSANTAIGNSSGTLTLTSNAFNLTSGGAISGVTGYAQGSGNFAISGTGTFSTGSGAVSLNGDTTVTTGKNFTVTAGSTSLTGAAAGSSVATTINAGAASNTGLIIQGAASQTADLLQIQDSTGANLIHASGTTLQAMGYFGNPWGGIGVATNLLTWSDAFENAAWVKTNVTNPTANTITDPRGSVSAESLATTASGGSVAQTSGTATSNTNFTFAIWLKTASGTQNVDLRIDGATSGTGTAKTVTATTTWQRFWVTQNTNGFSGNVKVNIFPGTTGGSGTVHASGGQLSQSSGPTIYLSTTTGTLSSQSGLVSSLSLFVGSSSILNGGVTVNNGQGTFNVGVTIPTANGLTLGTTGTNNGGIVFRSSNASAGDVTLRVSTTQGTTARTLTLPDEDGTLCIQGSTNCGFAPSATNGYVQLAPSAAQADGTTNSSIFINKTASGNLVQLQNSGSDVFTISNAGAVSAVGVNAGSGLLQGTGGLTLTGAASINNVDISTGGAITDVAGLTLASGNFLQNGTGTFGTGTGAVSLNGNTTVTGGNSLTVAAGSVAFQKGSDYSTTGTSNDVNLGSSALVRLTGASAQTITGITGGVDGRLLTIINAGSATAVISNNSAGSSAANRITTGTGGDINLTVGASITMVYDSSASLWRVTGASAATGGAGVNTIGTFNSATSYANGAQISGTTLTFGAADATNPGLVSTAAQTFAGDKTFNGQIIGAAGISSTGGAVSLTGNAASSLTTTSGALTLTSAAAATWSTTAGNLTLQAGSGTVSLGTSTILTANGALTVQSTGATNLTLDTGGAATLNLGNTNATTINLGTNNNSPTINVGTGTGNDTLNFAIGSGTNDINIGNSSGTNTLDIVATTTITSNATGSIPLNVFGIAGQTASLVLVRTTSGASVNAMNITSDGSAFFQGAQPAQVSSGNGTNGGVFGYGFTVTAAAGGNTTAAGGNGGNGAHASLTGGAGGNAGAGGVAGAGGSVILQGGAPGTGASGFWGGVNIQAGGGYTGIGTNAGLNTLLVKGVTTTDLTAVTMIGTGGTNFKGLVLQGVAGQTANLLEIQDSTGASGILFSVGSAGLITGNGGMNLTGTTQVNTSGNSNVTIGNTAGSGVVTLAGASGNVRFDTANAQFTESASARTFGVQTRTSNAAGTALTIAAGGAGSGASAFVGGALTLQGGNAAGTGNANGGNVNISGGTGVGTGARGLVVIDTPTVNTTTADANCGATTTANCTIAAGTVNNSSSVIVGVSTNTGVTISMPDPTITTAGRIFYFTAANGSLDFTLSLNGGGTGNTIAMRQNTTATLIWNGSDWTAAGASSSTTLQSAYDSTLSSAGGAEIVLNNTASSNGLTIRNNATSPIAGGLLEIQTSIGSNLFSVNNNATEYANNGGAESSTFTMWTGTPAGGTVSQSTSAGTMATGQASVSVVTTNTSHGAENTLTTTLTNNLQYTVSFTAKAASSSFNTLDVLYSQDGSATTSCATGKTVTTAIWTRISCTFTAPASGITASNSIFIRQSDSTGRTFYIDNLSVTVNASTNHAADGSVDSALGTNWTAFDADGGAGTTVLTRDTTTIYDTSGSVQDDTSNAANLGLRNNMSIVPRVSTQYLVSFYARSSNTFNDMTVGFLPAGGNSTPAAAQLCTDYNTQSVSTTGWTKVTCIITTPSSGITDPDLVIYQPTASDRIFYVDALTISLNTNTASNVQVGGGSNGGPATLFTLDRSATAPIAANNDAYLGSMYYDTVTGRIQCYEADGWGACGAAPDTSIVLTPEYTGAVLNGTGVGTMTADFCANQSTVLQVNTSFCASGLSRNYYKWTSPQSTMQTYSIYVSYKLPSTFKTFNDDSTINLTALTDSTSNGSVTYEVFRSSGSAVSRCYDGGTTETAVTSVANTWQTVGVNGNEATSCSFTAGDNVIFKINVKAQNNANVYVENLSFTYTNK